MKIPFIPALASAMILATQAFGQADSVQALTDSMPSSPQVWASSGLPRLAKDALHQGRPMIEIDPGLMDRQARARDLSLVAAKSRMMQRFAARDEEQRLTGNRGAESGSAGN